MKTIVAACLLLGACSSEENLGDTPRRAYTTLAHTAMQQNYDLQTDGAYVYWFVESTTGQTPDDSRSTLFRVPKAGGDVERLGVVSSTGPVIRFKIADGYVYMHRQGDHDIARIATTGGSIEHLIDAPEETAEVVAIDDTSVYVVEETTHGDELTRTTLWRAPRAGGSREDLFVGFPFLSNFNTVAGTLSWIGSAEDIWIKAPSGSPTQVLPMFGSDASTQRLATYLVSNADSLFVFSTRQGDSQTSYFDTALTGYKTADGTTTELGTYSGMTVFAAASTNGVYAGDIQFDPNNPPADPTMSPPIDIVMYPLDGRGRQLLWTSPAGNNFGYQQFDSDGSALYWIDQTAGEINRTDFDLTSILQ